MFNRRLFRDATDKAQEDKRPLSLGNLQEFLAAGGDPNLRIRVRGLEFTLLSAATASGWCDATRVLLAAGAAARDGGLAYAAADGHLSIVEMLLAAGADIHADGDRALVLATAYKRLPMIDRLLSAGADVHVCEDQIPRLLASNADQPIAARLLAAGADATVGWVRLRENEKKFVAPILDTFAAILSPAQRDALMKMSPRRFPAMRSLQAAECRRAAARHHPSGRGG